MKQSSQGYIYTTCKSASAEYRPAGTSDLQGAPRKPYENAQTYTLDRQLVDNELSSEVNTVARL